MEPNKAMLKTLDGFRKYVNIPSNMILYKDYKKSFRYVVTRKDGVRIFEELTDSKIYDPYSVEFSNSTYLTSDYVQSGPIRSVSGPDPRPLGIAGSNEASSTPARITTTTSTDTFSYRWSDGGGYITPF